MTIIIDAWTIIDRVNHWCFRKCGYSHEKKDLTWRAGRFGTMSLGVLAGGFCTQAGQVCGTILVLFGGHTCSWVKTVVFKSTIFWVEFVFIAVRIACSATPSKQPSKTWYATGNRFFGIEIDIQISSWQKNTFINSAASHQPLRWVNGAHTLRSRTALEPSKSFLA